MKLKKAIGVGVMTCCLVVTGMVSFGEVHTEAAACDHTLMQVLPDDQYDEYHDSTYHYTVYGDHYSCPRCSYNYWVGLYTVKSSHSFYYKDGKLRCDCGYSK